MVINRTWRHHLRDEFALFLIVIHTEECLVVPRFLGSLV